MPLSHIETMTTYLNEDGETVLITDCKDGRYTGVRKKTTSRPRGRRNQTERVQYSSHGIAAVKGRGGNLVSRSHVPWT
jgi:hypothetical protein